MRSGNFFLCCWGVGCKSFRALLSRKVCVGCPRLCLFSRFWKCCNFERELQGGTCTVQYRTHRFKKLKISYLYFVLHHYMYRTTCVRTVLSTVYIIQYTTVVLVHTYVYSERNSPAGLHHTSTCTGVPHVHLYRVPAVQYYVYSTCST